MCFGLIPGLVLVWCRVYLEIKIFSLEGALCTSQRRTVVCKHFNRPMLGDNRRFIGLVATQFYTFWLAQIKHCALSHTHLNDSSLAFSQSSPHIAVVCVFCGLSLRVPWMSATCTFWERLRALWQLFLLALEFGGLRGPQSITALSSPHLSPPFPAPASLQLISAPQAVVTTHHIMT